MQILLSPAKDMTDSPSVSLPSLTTPLFLAEAEHSAEQMSELSTEELSQLLKINPQLAALNKQRYTDFPALSPQAAVLSYVSSPASCRIFARRSSLCPAALLDDVFSLWTATSARWYQKLSP